MTASIQTLTHVDLIDSGRLFACSTHGEKIHIRSQYRWLAVCGASLTAGNHTGPAPIDRLCRTCLRSDYVRNSPWIAHQIFTQENVLAEDQTLAAETPPAERQVVSYAAAEGAYQPFDSASRGDKTHITVGYKTAACGSSTRMWSSPGPVPAWKMCKNCARIGVRDKRIVEVFE